MGKRSMFTVTDGLAVLGPDALRIVELLERRIAAWASEIGARPHSYPPLLRVEDLSRIDYFTNFPHLGVFVGRIRDDALATRYAEAQEVKEVAGEHIEPARYALPSAACYSIYFHLHGSTLAEPVHITTIARCFRNEERYTELSRLWGFQMRELVCLGPLEASEQHLRAFRVKIAAFAEAIELPLTISVATDPFYDRSSARAKMQQLFPVKEEFVYDGTVAIASLNFHRNFFGERCQIATGDGKAAFTSCVAFGIERWLHALDHRFEGNVERIIQVLESASR